MNNLTCLIRFPNWIQQKATSFKVETNNKHDRTTLGGDSTFRFVVKHLFMFYTGVRFIEAKAVPKLCCLLLLPLDLLSNSNDFYLKPILGKKKSSAEFSTS